MPNRPVDLRRNLKLQENNVERNAGEFGQQRKMTESLDLEGDIKQTDPLLRNTTLDIPVPNDGVFYYPCCGNDIRRVFGMFCNNPQIKEYHFDDIRNMTFINGKSILCRNYSDKVCSQIYKLSSGEKKVYYHLEDALMVLDQLKSISVFFLRRDSEGEGGSRIWWFGEKVFQRVLAKMLPGALLITDGSNVPYQEYDAVPGRYLRGLDERVQSLEMDFQFECHNRCFKLIGAFSNTESYNDQKRLYIWRVL